MRIGFDARMITHPGIGRYIRSLVPELIRQAPGDEFVLFGDTDKLKDMAGAPNVRIVKWKAPVYSIQEQISFPFDRAGIDLVHVPHFNVPVLCRKKMVVTIHDLIYLLFAQSVPSPLARSYARYVMGKAVRKSAGVIAVSKHTRNDILNAFGENYAGRIKTVYEAADKSFKKVENADKLKEVREKYGLSDRILLYVGSVKPHKNVITLLKVYGALRERRIPQQLVIVGKWDEKEDRLKSVIKSNENIRYLGEVEPDDLVVLYSLADVLVHLSFYEGFGLTVLEAMQCGTPTVFSETSSLPEVAGDAGLAVSPLNVGQITDTVYNVLVNKELREGMIRTGLERAKQFSWGKAARKTLEVYHNNA